MRVRILWRADRGLGRNRGIASLAHCLSAPALIISVLTGCAATPVTTVGLSIYGGGDPCVLSRRAYDPTTVAYAVDMQTQQILGSAELGEPVEIRQGVYPEAEDDHHRGPWSVCTFVFDLPGLPLDSDGVFIQILDEDWEPHDFLPTDDEEMIWISDGYIQ